MSSVLSRRPRRSRRILATSVAVALLTLGFASTGNVADAAGGTLTMTPPSSSDAPLLVTAGAGGEVSVTVTNTDTKGSTSALKVELSSSDPAFQVNGGCNAVALGAGKTCTFVVSYAAAAAPTQDATASVAVSSKKPGIVATSTAFFKVVGVAPVAELSPAAGLDFGDSPVGQTTAAQEVTLSNSGNAPLEITSQDLGGANPGDFAQVDTTCGATLAAGAECTTSITFTPTEAGARSATFQVTDNATGSPQSVSLSGTTVNQADTTAPTVVARTPAVNGTSVAVGSNVTATFSENVTGADDTTMTLSTAGTLVAAAVSYNATTRVVTLDPDANLQADTRYTVTLTGGSSGISDLAGNPLVTVAWSFTTGPAPVVVARTPGINATGVSRTANVTATFSANVTGISTATVTLRVGTLADGSLVPAVVSYNATTRVATLNPTATLAANTLYTVRLTGGSSSIRDLADNPLLNTVWSFRTGA